MARPWPRAAATARGAEPDAGAGPERGLGGGDWPAGPAGGAQRRVPGQTAQRQDRANGRRSEREVAVQPRRARRPLGHRRLVSRRRAPDGRNDAHASQRQPVARMHTRRLTRITGPVQRSEEPVAAAVAGEDPTGAVGTVRGGRQPDDEHLRGLVAEARRWSPPVGLIGERRPLVPRHLLTPLDQARAGTAYRDPRVEGGEVGGRPREAHHLLGVTSPRGMPRRRVPRPPRARGCRRARRVPRDRMRQRLRHGAGLSGRRATGRCRRGCRARR